MQTGECEKARAQAQLRYEIGSRESTILDSAVGKVPGLQAGKSRARKRPRAIDNYLFHGVRTESGCCPASCSLSTDGSFSRG
jgi:hypothetical protein